MKRLIFLLLALLVAGSASAATKVQVMTDGVIDVDRLPTISFFQETDPSSPELGQIWWNNATNQLKVAGAVGVYAFNSTGLVEWDTTPEAFSFTDVENATTETVYTSDPITVSGINWPAAISVSGDASAKYYINSGFVTSENGTVSNGDTFRAVVTSSDSAGVTVNATVTVGGISDAYSVVTYAGCTGDYGEMENGNSGAVVGASTLYVARVPICSGGTPTLKMWLSGFNGVERRFIPVMYSNVTNGEGDVDDRPGDLLWNGSAAFNALTSSPGRQVSFDPGESVTGDFIWIGVLAESGTSSIRKTNATGYYRTKAVASFDVSSVPSQWPTEDAGASNFLTAFGVSY